MGRTPGALVRCVVTGSWNLEGREHLARSPGGAPVAPSIPGGLSGPCGRSCPKDLRHDLQLAHPQLTKPAPWKRVTGSPPPLGVWQGRRVRAGSGRNLNGASVRPSVQEEMACGLVPRSPRLCCWSCQDAGSGVSCLSALPPNLWGFGACLHCLQVPAHVSLRSVVPYGAWAGCTWPALPGNCCVTSGEPFALSEP